MTIKQIQVVAETDTDYIKRLTKLGIKKLGVGSKATVFQHPSIPGVAVKVFRHVKNDTAITWLNWCKSNPSVYVPKVLSIYKASNLTRNKDSLDYERHFKEDVTLGYYIAFLEKLTPIKWTDAVDFLASNNLGSVLYAGEDDMGMDNLYFVRKPDFSSIRNPKLRKVVLQIYALSRKAFLDLSKPNLMLRNNQLVFVDPVSD